MFKFLKNKIKESLSKFSKKVEEEPVEEIKEEPVEEKLLEKPVEDFTVDKTEKPKEQPEEKTEKSKEKQAEEDKEEAKEEAKEEIKEQLKEEIKEEPKEETLELLKSEKKSEDVILKEELLEEEKVKEEVSKEEVSKEEKEQPEEKESKKEESSLPAKEKLKSQSKEIIPSIESDKPKLTILKEKRISKEKPEEKPVKKGFFGKIKDAIGTTKISDGKFEELFWDLEITLLENNVAMEIIEKIKEDLKEELVEKPIPRGKILSRITSVLEQSISEVLDQETFDLIERAKEKTPFVICFIGVNGSGKTTSIAKVANLFKKNGLTPVLAAGDTFRAAAIDQLGIHANNLGIKMISQDYGNDAAAVAFDAVEHAKAKGKDVVLIDTAGRLHSNKNLMDELKKVIRIAKPDLKIFVGESITGNDCVEQAREFDEAVGIDGIILSKADIDEKGGAALSVSYITKKPILYLGVGQEYDDLEKYDKNKMLNLIGI